MPDRIAFYAEAQAAVLVALAAPDPELDAERTIMAQHYVHPAKVQPWQPGDPDPLRDGLLDGFRSHRSATP